VGSQILAIDAPLIMGIVNITDDSFYSGCRCLSPDQILARVYQIVHEGGAIVDIGAYSTRPNAEDVPENIEVERLMMAMNIIRRAFPQVVVSVDTFRSAVVRKIVEEYGEIIVNDISGGEQDANMFETIAKYSIPYILTHSRGTPKTMPHLTEYADLLGDITYWFSKKIKHLQTLGVCDIILDAGFGFAKTTAQNFQLLAHLAEFDIFGLPILAGISRKSMVYKTLNISPADALNGTSVLNLIALLNGADILRVHDVKAAMEVVKLWHTYEQNAC
jgi:dihydropteroate synthase